MTRALATILFSVLLCLGSVVDGSAQQSTTEGFVVGLDLGGAAVSFENGPTDSAGLVGARVGYGFNRIVTLYVSAYETDVDVPAVDGFDKVTFGHLDLGVRLHLANSRRRWVPYADLAMTFWPVSDVLKNGEQTTTDFMGLPTSSLGGGLAIYLSVALALDVNFKAGKGLFKDVPVGNILIEGREQHVHAFRDLDAESARFAVGVSWWPSRSPWWNPALHRDRRCVPSAGVVPRSNTAGMLPRLALPAGRSAGLGATWDFHHGLLGAAVGRRHGRLDALAPTQLHRRLFRDGAAGHQRGGAGVGLSADRRRHGAGVR